MHCPNCYHSRNTFGKTQKGLHHDGFILALKSINEGVDHLRVALLHNKRRINYENPINNIDKARSCLNYSLDDGLDPEGIVEHALDQIEKAGIAKLRKNAVMAIELVFSLPPNRHNQDTRDYFSDCYEWLQGEFPCEILSFDVHLDQTAPHAHALVLPLVGGKMCGSSLMGGKGVMRARNDRFHEAVAGKYGLSKTDPLYGDEKWIAVEKVKEKLRLDPISGSMIKRLVMGAIDCDPLPFMRELGIKRDGLH
ncbi:hypothetical protein G6652_02035 [Polynucleobacter paneuropaeus]|jgi:hypothetical protein|nr:hypothetical protein [Polynucleobacter paneuropaeus]MBT8616012.1 hypothetical protein [Polynucleobacter paneuropaeus]MBT8617893.1 hypothetical protein [Polynucleobacter paneuropaeus]MBT8619774.1 hypothetical protein [Polynucleobacter paneuropaeus]MBT8625309.1 hypothetical protein [Polynucleobacter paneuropaeus]